MPNLEDLKNSSKRFADDLKDTSKKFSNDAKDTYKTYSEDARDTYNRYSEDVRDSKNRLSDDMKREWGNIFSQKSRRERMSKSRRIVIDPVSFVIGGLGAVTIGLVGDELNEGDRENSGALRAFIYPIRSIIRFLAGGCIYVAVDSLTVNLFGTSYPLISGSITGLCFANGSRPVVLLGSISGMAVFSEIADIIMDGLFNKNFIEI